MKTRLKYNKTIHIIIALSLVTTSGCKKFVEVAAPTDKVSSASVFQNDATAIAAMTGIYTTIVTTNLRDFPTSILSLSSYAGLSADELIPYLDDGANWTSFYTNTLTPTTFGFNYWTFCYPLLYNINQIIEGVNNSEKLKPAVQQQILGEAKFARAFIYFYLVNLYGDVPLVLTTDYKVNANIGRTKTDLIYEQMISDLAEAKDLLSATYLENDLITSKSTTERLRPIRSAASALLARVYLYKKDYSKAEKEATEVINTALFTNGNLSTVFLKNNTEAIWQLQPLSNGQNTPEAWTFIVPSDGFNGNHPFYLSANLLSSFESGDQRRVQWIDSIEVSGTEYYYPYKYKSATLGASVTEYSTVFRLAEQYLIRAEARAYLSNISGAQADLDVIRNKAGLPNTTASSTTTLADAILHERQVEFFTEWGHRWFDLKRTDKADQVLSVIKGSNWQTTDQLYPIPQSDINRNPGLKGKQNPGYQ